jgi:hypothetical protein
MMTSQGVGEVELMRYACVTCHIVPGVRAPLTAWTERHFIAGTPSTEPDNLIRRIMGPQEIEPDTAMPDVGINNVAARDMTAYLYRLRQ